MAGQVALGAGREVPGRPRVEHHHLAAPEDLEGPVGPDEDGRRLVDADSEQLGVLQDDGDQAIQALAGHEVLVDDDAVEESQPGRGDDVVGEDGGEALLVLGRRVLLVAGDHERSHDGGAGAGAGHDPAPRVDLVKALEQRGPEERPGQPALVTAGEEDAGHAFERVQGDGISGRLRGGLKGECLARSGLLGLRRLLRTDLFGNRAGVGDDGDAGLGPPGQLHDAGHELRRAFPAPDDQQVTLRRGRDLRSRGQRGEGQAERECGGRVSRVFQVVLLARGT